MADPQPINKSVTIDASPSRVWSFLTTPALMQTWMMPDLELDILTNWTVGGPILMHGTMNGKKFENRGTVLQFEPEQTLVYSHLSSISRLPDRPESYAILEFRLRPADAQTILDFTVSSFPTESIYHHLAFYWNVTLEVLKRTIEGQGVSQ